MKTELKWAFILGIVTFLWFVLEKISGFDAEFIEYHQTIGYFHLIPFILVYYLALMQKKNLDLGGFMSLIEGVKASALIAILSVPFILVAAYLKVTLLSPDFLDNMMDFMITTGVDEAVATKAMSLTGFLLATAGYALSGFVFGAIISFFLKNK